VTIENTTAAVPAPRNPPEWTPPATCQYCLADCRYTTIAFDKPENERCPVCGCAYTGPRRTAEYRVLLEAGLVARGDY
jgi:hypothetical protein